MQRLLRPLPGFYRVLEPGVTAQVVPLSLETDRGPPALLGCQPVYARDAAGVVAPHGLSRQHLNTRTVNVRQAWQPCLSPSGKATAAGGMSTAQTAGPDHRLPAAVTPAVPGSPPAHVLRWRYNRQLSVPLPNEVNFPPAVTWGFPLL